MLENGLILEQRQVISAGQVQSLEILSYTNQELEEFLENEYLENPLIESVSDKQETMIHDLELMYEKGVSYREQYIQWDDEDCNRKGDVRAKGPNEVEEFILGQLHRKDYCDEEWRLIRYLIHCLDEKGFFTDEVAEVAGTLGCSEEKVQSCLSILRGLEPVGIFSRNISECLVRQLEKQNVEDQKLLTMIKEYMPEILEGHIGVVAKKLHISMTKVKEYIQLIGTLYPRPIMNVREENIQYIVPDILAEWEGGQWKVIINDKWMSEYKYNDFYMKMMRSSEDEELKEYFLKKLERARFVMNCVEQRRRTLMKVVEAILNMQTEYFRCQKSLRPMTLEDIALRTDMHVSTVSRAIRGKYLQYKKTVLIRDLFVGAMSDGMSSEEVSVDDIRNKIKEMIECEDKEKPLSDQHISALLKDQGINVSRRTISKYRIQMGILDSRQRLYYK